MFADFIIADVYNIDSLGDMNINTNLTVTIEKIITFIAQTK